MTNHLNQNDLTVELDASLSSEIYGNSKTVQPPSTEQYLYFYVGNTLRNETEVDVGTVTEQLNGKQDVLPDNVDYVVETYNDGANWYRVYKSGWIEQGGQVLSLARGATSEVVFLIPFTNNNYALTFGTFGEGYNSGEANFRCTAYSETGATFYNNSGSITTYKWCACGQGV